MHLLEVGAYWECTSQLRSLAVCPLPCREREAPPRFAQPGSLEYDVAARWKTHYESEKMQREDLEQRLKEGRNQLQQDMHTIKEQHQTLLLRQGEYLVSFPSRNTRAFDGLFSSIKAFEANSIAYFDPITALETRYL